MMLHDYSKGKEWEMIYDYEYFSKEDQSTVMN